MNSARSVMATIRSPIGMVDAGLPTSDGPSCWGLALMESIGGSLRFRLNALCKVRRALRNAAGGRQGHPPGIADEGPDTAPCRAKEHFAQTCAARTVPSGARHRNPRRA